MVGDHELAITEFSTREYNHYPLTVAAMPGRELGLRVEYDTEVFDAASIEALIERLQRVLVAMTADPARRLSSIDVLDAGEHARLDEVGNRAVLTRPAPAGGVDSGVVRRAGGPRAGGGGGESATGRSWTYRELDEAANRLAHLLAGHGVGPGERVAVLCAALGARRSWRSWRCSRPGRPMCRSTRRIPDARIGFVLADAAPIAALTTAGLADGWTGMTWWSSISTTPPSTASPAPRCRRRRRRTSRI